MSDKVKIIEKEVISDISDDVEIQIPYRPEILNKLRDNLFIEGTHYVKASTSKGESIVILKKQASSLVAAVFGISIKIVSVTKSAHIPPNVKTLTDKLFVIMKGEKSVKNRSYYLNEIFKMIKKYNLNEAHEVSVKALISDSKRSLEYVGCASDVLLKKALSLAQTYAIRNGIFLFFGL